MFDILVKKQAQQVVDWRNETRRVYGEHYESRVAPFRSLLVHHCKQTKQGAVEGARGLIAFLASRGKQSKHLKAVLFSSAVDILERKLI